MRRAGTHDPGRQTGSRSPTLLISATWKAELINRGDKDGVIRAEAKTNASLCGSWAVPVALERKHWDEPVKSVLCKSAAKRFGARVNC
jgi:hypothetical protein